MPLSRRWVETCCITWTYALRSGGLPCARTHGRGAAVARRAAEVARLGEWVRTGAEASGRRPREDTPHAPDPRRGAPSRHGRGGLHGPRVLLPRRPRHRLRRPPLGLEQPRLLP